MAGVILHTARFLDEDGDAGHCSLTTTMLCVFDEDCPASEGCTIVGSAYNLHYRIERLP